MANMRFRYVLGAIFGLHCSMPIAAEAPPPGLEKIPEVVARVDEHEITRRELIRELVGSASMGALGRLVRRQLIEQAAVKLGISVTPEELETQLKVDEINLRNDMRLVPGEVDAHKFEELISTRYQMSLEEYKNMVVRQRLLSQKAVGRNIRPAEADLRRFFKHKPYAGRNLTVEEILQPPVRLRAAHILLTPLNPVDLYRGNRLKTKAGEKAALAAERAKRKDEWYRNNGVEPPKDLDLDVEPEWQEMLARANQVLAELQSGKLGWEAAVEKYTQDPHDMRPLVNGKRQPSIRETNSLAQGRKLEAGEVGWFTREGPLVEEFYEGSKHLRKKGELAGPVRTQFGYHIIRLLEDADVPAPKSYEELRPQVEKIYVVWLLQSLSEQWLEVLEKEAHIETTRALLWHPDAALPAEKEADPIVCKVNGQPIRRSEVWTELLRGEGPEALDRLINREMAMGPLKRLGPARLEWEGKAASQRRVEAPPAEPIVISVEEADRELTYERLRLDKENEDRRKADPKAESKSFDTYIRENFGQSAQEFQRTIEAGLTLAKAVRMKTDLDESRLLFEFYLSRETYREPVSFHINQILLRLKPDADPRTREDFSGMARDLRKECIEKRKTWEEIAAAVRDANDLGAGRDATMILAEGNEKYAEVYQELVRANYETGQISEPIFSRHGVHLVKILKRISERMPEFSEVRDKVQRDYLRGRGSLYVDVWLRSMKNQARVQRFIFNQEKLEIPDALPMPRE